MKIINYFIDYITIKKDDVFLVSYPKSGNTRFRLAIAKYLQLMGSLNKYDFDFEFTNKIMPELGKGNINSAKEIYSNIDSLSKFPSFIKSHLPYYKLRLFNKNNSIILIVRLEPDTIMSYYDYTKALGTIKI